MTSSTRGTHSLVKLMAVALLASGCTTLGIENEPPEQQALREGVNHEHAYQRDTSGRQNNSMACGSGRETRCNWVWSRPSRRVAEQEALAQCERETGAQCFTFATNHVRSAWARDGAPAR